MWYKACTITKFTFPFNASILKAIFYTCLFFSFFMAKMNYKQQKTWSRYNVSGRVRPETKTPFWPMCTEESHSDRMGHIFQVAKSVMHFFKYLYCYNKYNKICSAFPNGATNLVNLFEIDTPCIGFCYISPT